MVNKCIFIGNLGEDAELRHTQGGQAYLRFRIAVTEKWRDGDGKKQEHTEWLSCVLWGKRAESLAEYMTKGTRVYVAGRIRSREYEDKEGVKRRAFDINVDELELLGGGRRDDDRRDDRGRDRGDGHRSSGRDRRDDDRRPRGRDDRDDRRSSRDDRGRDDRSQSRGGSQRPPRDADDVFGDDDIPF